MKGVVVIKKSFDNNKLPKVSDHAENTLVRLIQSRFDELRRVKNPVRNDALYIRYCRSVELIREFLDIDNRGNAILDDPDSIGKFHTATIFIINEDFEGDKEINLFCEILKSFDSFTISYMDNKIVITLLIEGIYTEK